MQDRKYNRNLMHVRLVLHLVTDLILNHIAKKLAKVFDRQSYVAVVHVVFIVKSRPRII